MRRFHHALLDAGYWLSNECIQVGDQYRYKIGGNGLEDYDGKVHVVFRVFESNGERMIYVEAHKVPEKKGSHKVPV